MLVIGALPLLFIAQLHVPNLQTPRYGITSFAKYLSILVAVLTLFDSIPLIKCLKAGFLDSRFLSEICREIDDQILLLRKYFKYACFSLYK